MFQAVEVLLCGFEHNHGLVGSRNDGHGNRDQVAALIENAQPGWFPFARIEPRGDALRRRNVARFDLRQRKIEFRAMPDASFDHGKHGGAG